MTFPQWGTVADLMAAVGTTGAFGVSLYLLNQQMKDRRAENEAKKEAQARRVSIWSEGVVDEDATSEKLLDARRYFMLAYVVKNGSDDPIYEVHARLTLGTQGTVIRYLGMMGPAETRRIRVLAGRSKPVGDKSPEVVFTDANDQTWYRGRRGVLTRLAPLERPELREPDKGAFSRIEDNPLLHLLPAGEPRLGTRIYWNK